MYGTTWNYRVIKRTFKDSEGNDEIEYSIHEVFYDKNNKIISWTEQPVAAVDSHIVILGDVLDRMKVALTKPVLIEVDNKLIEE